LSTPADLALAVEAARAAGVVVMKAFRTDQRVTFKSADQPLTEADLASDQLIKEALMAVRPTYGWLSEETADTTDRLQRTHVWVVDPIDGTRSFVAGRAEFAISIGLAVKGEAVLGVVYNPATRELFTALKGGGAYAGERPTRLNATRRRFVLAASRSELKRGEFTSFQDDYDILPTGSTAYKLAKVAAGDADAFLSRGPKAEWDLCAGALIVEEAGGVVTDLGGNALQYNRPNPHITGVLAGSARLHAEILRRITDSTERP